MKFGIVCIQYFNIQDALQLNTLKFAVCVVLELVRALCFLKYNVKSLIWLGLHTDTTFSCWNQQCSADQPLFWQGGLNIEAWLYSIHFLTSEWLLDGLTHLIKNGRMIVVDSGCLEFLFELQAYMWMHIKIVIARFIWVIYHVYKYSMLLLSRF